MTNSRFRFDEILFKDVNFHRLNLTRGSFYIPLLGWIGKNKAIINTQNDDEECSKWAVIAVLDWPDIKFHHERISNLNKFENNHDWSGLEFPIAIYKIGVFEKKNDISVTILGVKRAEFYICRKSQYKAS